MPLDPLSNLQNLAPSLWSPLLTCRSTVKARDLYQLHLEHFPRPYPTKEAYEEFLTREAAGFVARRRRCFERRPILPEKIKELARAISLNVPGNLSWDQNNHPILVRDVLDEVARQRAAADAFYRRSIFALLGGFALIVPMLIMKLYPTTLDVCLTTTLFVIAAALLLALFMKDTEPKDVLGITAAYAAVLVVFVGTSTTASGVDNKKVAIIMGSIVGALALVMVFFSMRMRPRARDGVSIAKKLLTITRT